MKRLLPLLLPLILAAKCTDLPYPPPPVELCGISVSLNDLICNDPRLPVESQNYKRAPKVGDLCTNADDFELIKKDNIELRTKLYKLEKTCKPQ